MKKNVIKLIINHSLAILLFICSCKPIEFIPSSDLEFIHARDSVITSISQNYEEGDFFMVNYGNAEYLVKKMALENQIIDTKYYGFFRSQGIDNPIKTGIISIFIITMISVLITNWFR